MQPRTEKVYDLEGDSKMTIGAKDGKVFVEIYSQGVTLELKMLPQGAQVFVNNLQAMINEAKKQ